jgi:sugar lactone lactonase YvrE
MKHTFVLLTAIIAACSHAFAQQYVVTTVAGAKLNYGISKDGRGDSAGFGSMMNHIVADEEGNLYVADAANLRKISPDGNVTTLFGENIMVGDESKEIAYKLPAAAYGIVLDKNHNIILSLVNQTIIRIRNDKEIELIAGVAEERGNSDGSVSQAKFSDPHGMCIDRAGNIYIADNYNARIRKITADERSVQTVAGDTRTDYQPGTGKTAHFPNEIHGIAVDSKGNLYVSVNGSRGSCVAKISPSGVVTTFAGDAEALSDDKDGIGKSARLNSISAICCDTQDNIWVAEDRSVRKISPTGMVTTIAGKRTDAGSKKDGVGPDARFSYLNGICADMAGNIYVTDFENYDIRKISKQ